MPNISAMKRHEDVDYILISSTLSYDDLKKKLNDDAEEECFTLPAYSENKMLETVHNALRHRKQILDLVGVEIKATLSKENTNSCVPEDLYICTNSLAKFCERLYKTKSQK